eukprot:643982-Pyramimonas_sp.AAC.1
MIGKDSCTFVPGWCARPVANGVVPLMLVTNAPVEIAGRRVEVKCLTPNAAFFPAHAAKVEAARKTAQDKLDKANAKAVAKGLAVETTVADVSYLNYVELTREPLPAEQLAAVERKPKDDPSVKHILR